MDNITRLRQFLKATQIREDIGIEQAGEILINCDISHSRVTVSDAFHQMQDGTMLMISRNRIESILRDLEAKNKE